MTSKEKYRIFCAADSNIPIFSMDWWLDATVGENNWDVSIVERDGNIVASLPFVVQKKYGFVSLGMPPISQCLGPWMKEFNCKNAKKLDYQKKFLNELMDGLPKFHQYSQNWHYQQINWLPFYWRGYNQHTRYTYILNNICDSKTVWSGFMEKVRTDIRKAENKNKIIVRDDLLLDDFLRLSNKTFERQSMGAQYPDDIARRIDEVCSSRNCRRIFIAEDEEGRHHAGVYIVWDKNSAYYIMGGGDPDLRNSGATSLCIWQAIQHAAVVTNEFNFCGSMMEPIERFFRAFGAIQTPYFNVSIAKSRAYKAFSLLKRI